MSGYCDRFCERVCSFVRPAVARDGAGDGAGGGAAGRPAAALDSGPSPRGRELARKLGRLRMEVDVLKEAMGLPHSCCYYHLSRQPARALKTEARRAKGEAMKMVSSTAGWRTATVVFATHRTKAARPQPAGARFLRGRAERETFDRHHRVRPGGRQALPESGHRLLRRQGTGPYDGKAPRHRRSLSQMT